MAVRIDAAADATGQPRPRTVGQYVRCIDDSLALAYRRAVRRACALAGRGVSALHMVGGGTANELLCRAAADATGLPVHAGPAEATALGNILVAARGASLIDGDLAELRRMVRASSEIVEYVPDPAVAPAWEAAERRLFGSARPNRKPPEQSTHINRPNRKQDPPMTDFAPPTPQPAATRDGVGDRKAHV